MSNSGVNTGFAKCFIFFMAVVILVQGGVYLCLSVWGITHRECSKGTSDISSKPFQFAMDLVYFLNEDCGNPFIKVPDVSENITLVVNFHTAEPIENRTFIFFITYAAISSLWVITSLAIITVLCGPITKTVNGLCFWPWYLAIMAGSILDAVATGYHVHDVINTTSVVKAFNYLGITARKEAMEILSNYDVYFVSPAVIMTCISSRVILIWLLNIFGSCFCLSLSNTLSKRNSSKERSITSVATASTAPVTHLQQQSSQEISPVQTQQLQELSRIDQRSMAALPPLQTQNFQIQSKTNQSFVPPYNVHSPTTVSISNLDPTAPSPDESQTNIDYRNESSSDRLSHTPQRNVSQYQQELSPTSPLNNRYSTNTENFQFPIQNQRVSQELRGQLPWSYTNMPPAASTKKSPMQVYPEIPAPDYGQ